MFIVCVVSSARQDWNVNFVRTSENVDNRLQKKKHNNTTTQVRKQNFDNSTRYISVFALGYTKYKGEKA